MSLTLLELAQRLKGWRGPYLGYAFAIGTAAPIMAEHRPHLNRVIARHSGVSSTDGLSPDDPRRAKVSKAIACYTAATKRRRDALADYSLDLAVRDALQVSGVVVTARNALGAVETLRAADRREASIDLAANVLTIGGFAYTQVEVEVPTPETVKAIAPGIATPAQQMTVWLREQGLAYMNSRTRDEIAEQYRMALSLHQAPSRRTVDRAKKEAREVLESASSRAK